MKYLLVSFLLLCSCAPRVYRVGLSYITPENNEFDCRAISGFVLDKTDKHVLFDCDGQIIHLLVREKVK